MPVCPNCKNGSAFTQTKPKIFTCSACKLKIEIADDWNKIEVTLDGKTYYYPQQGWFEQGK